MNSEMNNENNPMNDAISSLQAAFSDGASVEEMKKGEHVLSAMLTALRGAMSASASEAESTTTPKQAARSSASPPASRSPSSRPEGAASKKASKGPDMLDFVVGFLKSKLDDDDLAAVESQAPPFSVPFINM